MTMKEITRLAIKFVTDKFGDKEYNIVWNLSKEELNIFYEAVNNLSAKRA